jgi:hypothetical protein
MVFQSMVMVCWLLCVAIWIEFQPFTPDGVIWIVQPGV